MTVERGVRVLAGSFILISLGLGRFYSPYWYLLTLFVGLNLFQSGLTGWCLAANILQKLGLKQGGANSCS
jgi:hypothetical protein